MKKVIKTRHLFGQSVLRLFYTVEPFLLRISQKDDSDESFFSDHLYLQTQSGLILIQEQYSHLQPPVFLEAHA